VSARKIILTSEVAEKKMQRIALEIAGELYDEKEPLIIIGVNGSGMVIAQNIHRLLLPMLQMPVELITCNINKREPLQVDYSSQVDFNNKNVLVVDDVTNSGRTLLYAIKPLLKYFPKRIQTMSLLERMHKSYPVKIDYIGLSIATTLQDHISVEVENGVVTGAYLQ
jgi:pyrimidine operon attenuation protein/uracil phosphoribosyltransferase